MSNIRGFSDIKKQDSGKGAPGGMPPGFPGFPGFPGPGGPANNAPEKQGKVKCLHREGELNEELTKAGSQLAVVDFTASWCGPCKMIAPHYAELSEKYTNVLFFKVDVDECPKTADKCGVRAMPTFQFYKSGQKIDQLEGADPTQLKSLIEKHQTGSSATTSSWSGSGYVLGAKSSDTSSTTPVVDNNTQQQQQKPLTHQSSLLTGGYTLGGPSTNNTTNNTTTTSTTTPSSSSNATNNDVNELFLSQLIEMGFPESHATTALQKTGNRSLEAAMDWCFNNDSSATSTSTTNSTTTTTPMDVETSTPATATVPVPGATFNRPKTIHNAVCNNCMDQIIGTRHKCEMCDDYDLCHACYTERIQFHPSDHTFGSYDEDIVIPGKEKKPLTPEEIEVEKLRIKEKVKKIREQRAIEEEKSNIEREKMRRVSGKEAAEAKRLHQQRTLEREAEIRRKEKEEEARAKAAIKAKIEQDRLNRTAKLNNTNTNTTTNATTTANAPTTTTTTVTEYTETTIQVRLPDGNVIKASFKPTDPIRTVHDHMALLTNTPNFTLSTTFPRKVYSPKDNSIDTITLKQAELVPSGTLIYTKL